MKKLLILLILLTPFTVQSLPLVNNSIGYQYTPFLYAVCEELGIEHEIFLYSTDKELNGYVVKTGLNSYVIFVNKIGSSEPIKQIIAHELLHIKDDIDGIWDINKGTTKIYKGFHRFVSKEAKEVEKRVSKESKVLYNKYRKL